MNCLFCNEQLKLQKKTLTFERYICENHKETVHYNVNYEKIDSYIIGYNYPYIFISLIDKQSVIVTHRWDRDIEVINHMPLSYIVNCTPDNYLQKIQTILTFS